MSVRTVGAKFMDRGDVNAIVVVDRSDVELAAIADALDARHPVDV